MFGVIVNTDWIDRDGIQTVERDGHALVVIRAKTLARLQSEAARKRPIGLGRSDFIPWLQDPIPTEDES